MENRIAWPNDSKCAVMITFDVDGDLLVPRPDGQDWQWPRSASYGIYGPKTGMPRLLELLGRYNIPATFFSPGCTVRDYPSVFRDAVSAGHELAYHGWDHETVEKTPLPQRLENILKVQDIFASVGSKPGVGWRNPNGDFLTDIAQMAFDNGFIYSSSMRGDDRPYRTVLKGEPSEFIEIPAKFELDDYPLFAYEFYPTQDLHQNRIHAYPGVFDSYRREFDGYYKYGLCFVLMLHPQVISRPGRIQYLERFLQYILSFPDVWFATGEQVARFWQANY